MFRDVIRNLSTSITGPTRAAVLSLLFLAGCATPGPVASIRYATGSELLGIERVTNKNFEFNVPQSAFVGDSMIRVQDFERTTFESSTVRIQSPFTITGEGLSREYRAGQNFQYGGKVLVNGAPMPFLIDGRVGVIFDDAGMVELQVLVGVPTYGAYLSPLLATDAEAGSVERIPSESVSDLASGRNFEIIYSGLDASTIRLSYREFTSANMAREPFFQNLSYPASSPTIRFRDMVIALHEVTPESITYEVLDQGD